MKQIKKKYQSFKNNINKNTLKYIFIGFLFDLNKRMSFYKILNLYKITR